MAYVFIQSLLLASPVVCPGGEVPAEFPFSFVYDDIGYTQEMASFARRQESEKLDAQRTRVVTTWTHPDGKLRLVRREIHYRDFPAVESLLTFENVGREATGIVGGINALDYATQCPLQNGGPYRLHHTAGGAATHEDFKVSEIIIGKDKAAGMGGSFGRSSNSDLPFFRIDTGSGSVIVAVGWTGRWRAEVASPDDRTLRITAGLQKARFRLLPGESLRMPRLLMLTSSPDHCNSLFRLLIHQHYALPREGRPMQPIIFCNTCFIEGGSWLGDHNTADNQAAIVRELAPLGIEAVITDAGWMAGSQGQWHLGCGNWHARKDNYPEGIRPITKAAKEVGVQYGLWYEIESVIEGTDIFKNHPDWLIDIGARTIGDSHVALINFGDPQARKGVTEIVTRLMGENDLQVYRQDFGLLDPAPHWDSLDSPDRQGVAEIKYITGLYQYWEALQEAFPHALLEGCAAGGRRIDLETVMHFHMHQKTDYWFNNLVDQQSLWALSQYLPNHCIVAHLARLDDYSFHSTMASSLCVGWPVLNPAFSKNRAGVLVERYKKVRHLLTGEWYPLTGYSYDTDVWQAVQYHRPDLDEGIVLAFRRKDSPYRSLEVDLQGLVPDHRYRLHSDQRGELPGQSGQSLGHKYIIELNQAPASEMIHYKGVSE